LLIEKYNLPPKFPQQEELIKGLKEDLCGGQDCELTTELPECIENDIPNEIDSPAFYSIAKREIAASPKPIKKLKNPEKVELYVKISKNLGIWKSSSTRSDNIKRVKEELKKVNSSERFKKRLRNMNLDLTTLKLDEVIKCNAGSVSRKLVCGEFLVHHPEQCLKIKFSSAMCQGNVPRSCSKHLHSVSARQLQQRHRSECLHRLPSKPLDEKDRKPLE
jgi:hypothetical protein